MTQTSFADLQLFSRHKEDWQLKCYFIFIYKKVFCFEPSVSPYEVISRN